MNSDNDSQPCCSKNAARKRAKKANETEEETMQRRKADAERKRARMSQETPEESAQRRAVRAEAARTRRAIQRTTLSNLLDPSPDDENFVMQHDCGKLNTKCKECASYNFKDEKPQDGQFSQCCQKGKVKKEIISRENKTTIRSEYPTYLKSLMTNQIPESKNFMQNIRSYNSSFAFASMGATIASPNGHGPYCFRIQGQVYHRTGSLHPAEGDKPRFAQLYIFDTAEATKHRMEEPANLGCSETIMKNIHEIMINSDFAKSYKMLYEVEREAAAEPNVNLSSIFMAIKQKIDNDKRRYNNPTANEVAMIFKNADGEPPFNRDLLIHLRPTKVVNGKVIKTERLFVTNPNLDPMTYPILFPDNQQGWGTDLEQIGANSQTRVSQMQYYSYMLSIRDEFNPILNAGKLTQQYIVDAYVKTESNRLRFIKEYQSKLRVENYTGLMDHLSNRRKNEGLAPGKMIILPSTFEGSPRNMQQRYQDAMSIVTTYGKPDLFITMTCNPKWKEIVENLKSWQRPENRPDLIARVFYIKLKSLLNDITKKDLFGKVLAKVHVIEFQKRGLPHAHILIILEKDYKLNSDVDIDRMVKAEIPDKLKYPKLFEIVTTHMVHGPCGKVNPNCPCMENDICTKGFPKDFQDSTLGNIDGYPKYKRTRETSVQIGNKVIDNSWIVPYNPYLSLRYNCHINVEICASIKSVKYLFKYVYKGHDCADVEITEKNELNHDETKSFVDSRYVSAPEACWRLFSMRMHDQSHTIVRLAVHLPNQQSVCFDPEDIERAVENAAVKCTTLMAWFALNQTDSNAHNLRYFELPEHYLFQKGKWVPRKRGGDKVIGRMYSVSIRDTERYYLRLLLLHVKGATSFEQLKTVDGQVCESFLDASKQRGLLLDETVWRETMADAIAFQMPKQLRELFAYICAFGCPTDVDKIWEENKEQLIEDYCHKLHNNQPECIICEDYALRDIQEILITLNLSLSHFKLRNPQNNLPSIEVPYDYSKDIEEAERMKRSLNNEQLSAFEDIISAINSAKRRNGKLFFLDGPGGSGKTYLYTALMHYIKGRGEVVFASASTGIAANLLIGGRTYHSLYKLPVPIVETSVSNMGLNSEAAKQIREAKLLIMDECTMASRHAINTIDRLLREIMNDEYTPFGGKVFLLGGDFRQCLTIVPHAMRAAIVQASMKYSNCWSLFTELKLKNNMRSADPTSDYSTWLLKLGDGSLTNPYKLGEDIVEIPDEYMCSGSIVHDIYGDNITMDNVKLMAKRAILCPRNDDAELINNEVIDILQGDEFIYLSTDSVEDAQDKNESDNFPTEFLNSVTPSGMPPHKLKLKIGTIIILLRNLNTRRGLCNGTRLIVKGLKPHVIEAEVITGSSEGEMVLIPRIDICPSETDLPFKLRRRQFPVKAAFAMTINKSQGQTLEKVGIYLPMPVFGHGQLYVAFSRVRRACDVKVKVIDTPDQGKLLADSNKIFTRNVVYKEVFSKT